MNCVLPDVCRWLISDPQLFYIQLIVSAVSIVFGGFLMARTTKAIEIEIAFYRLINWKMEPVSMKKEVLDTRIMGGLVFVLGIGLLLFAIMQQL